MQAFVDWCNGFGGINGRKLELTKIDSKLFSHLEATKEACNADVFAIVGSGSVHRQPGRPGRWSTAASSRSRPTPPPPPRA